MNESVSLETIREMERLKSRIAVLEERLDEFQPAFLGKDKEVDALKAREERLRQLIGAAMPYFANSVDIGQSALWMEMYLVLYGREPD